jgi:biotin synthase-like enzyme
MPKTIIRLAAGRHTFSETEQAMVSCACGCLEVVLPLLLV